MPEDKLKPKSFRIDEETAEKIKLITAELGGNQQETLAKMIEAYEFQKGKAILTDKREDIESFEKYATILTRMFMGVLEENQDIKAITRAEFEAQLRSKDLTIQGLQEKSAILKTEKEEAATAAKTCREERDGLTDRLTVLQREARETAERLEAMLMDKEGLNRALTASCNEYRLKIEDMEEDIKQAKKVRAKLAELESENAVLQREVERLVVDGANKDKVIKDVRDEKERAIEGVRVELALVCEKRVLDMEREHQKAVQALDEAKRAEIDKYQKNYLSLLEKMEQGSVPHGEE